ncbi:MAG TPA: FtsQ-type POTRA domain-containing protein [Gemmatimonadaceae bacterium]
MRYKLALAGIVVLLAVTSRFWGPLLMRRMDYFRVRRVEIVGARYVAPSDILAKLHVDTTASVWDPTSALVARVASHPEIQHVAVHRKLPGTLVIEVTERVPIALVPASGGMRVYDERGVALPIDPARVDVDAPVLAERDLALLRLLARIKRTMPTFYARVSDVRRSGRDDVLLVLDKESVRVMPDVSMERLAEVAPVEEDLARKQLRVSEIDLRYRDQVIARLQ